MKDEMSSRERMMAALNCQAPDHTPCSFMLFGALHQGSEDYYDFITRQVTLGLDPYVMIPTRPPVVVNDHYNLHGLPVSYHPDVTIEESMKQAGGSANMVLEKTYHTPAGMLTTRIRHTDDWRWGEHVPFLDDYLIPRSEKFLIESEADLPAFQYLLSAPTEEEITSFRDNAAGAKSFARQQDLLVAGGWGVGMDMLGWVHGLNNLVFSLYDRPEFIRSLFAIIAKWNRDRMSVVLDHGVDLYIKRAWYENCDFFTPRMWQKLVQPQLRQDVDLAHDAGAKFGYIITSNAMPLLDLIVETGVDVIIGVDPHTYDLEETRSALGGRVCLWGGVNGHLTVEGGSEARVRAEVQTALQQLGPEGFILSPVDNVREQSDRAMRNVSVLIETWQAETGQN